MSAHHTQTFILARAVYLRLFARICYGEQATAEACEAAGQYSGITLTTSNYDRSRVPEHKPSSTRVVPGQDMRYALADDDTNPFPILNNDYRSSFNQSKSHNLSNFRTL